MAPWIALIVFYLWLGFTVGYFFRKWLERSYLPRYEAERAGGDPDRPPHRERLP